MRATADKAVSTEERLDVAALEAILEVLVETKAEAIRRDILPTLHDECEVVGPSDRSKKRGRHKTRPSAEGETKCWDDSASVGSECIVVLERERACTRTRTRARRKRRRRRRARALLVENMEEREKVIDPDELPQRARWTIMVTACLLLFLCLLLVGVTLRMAPLIDDMVRQENERMMHESLNIGTANVTQPLAAQTTDP